MSSETCEYCGATFDDREARDRHLRNQHDDRLSDAERERIYGAPLSRPTKRQFLATGGVLGFVLTAIAYNRFGSPDVEAANEFGYDTLRTDGVNVPLVPMEDAVQWHENGEAIFVDARSRTEFEKARVADAVLSPAPDGRDDDDPLNDVETETRIVTYCGCPHHLSTLRGASLIQEGYVDTYALEEGFFPWKDVGHPLAGEEVETTPSLYRIDGQTAPAHAGEFAWVRHEPTGQREPSPIREDGTFTIDVRFYELDPESEVRVSTPEGDRLGPINELSKTNVHI